MCVCVRARSKDAKCFLFGVTFKCANVLRTHQRCHFLKLKVVFLVFVCVFLYLTIPVGWFWMDYNSPLNVIETKYLGLLSSYNLFPSFSYLWSSILGWNDFSLRIPANTISWKKKRGTHYLQSVIKKNNSLSSKFNHPLFVLIFFFIYAGLVLI